MFIGSLVNLSPSHITTMDCIPYIVCEVASPWSVLHKAFLDEFPKIVVYLHQKHILLLKAVKHLIYHVENTARSDTPFAHGQSNLLRKRFCCSAILQHSSIDAIKCHCLCPSFPLTADIIPHLAGGFQEGVEL